MRICVGYPRCSYGDAQSGGEYVYALRKEVFWMNNNFQVLNCLCIFAVMKLTAKVRLVPTAEQEKLLFATLEEANKDCDSISDWTWANKTFGQYRIHHGTYHTVKSSFNLSAQAVVRCIAKVADSYKLDRKRQRIFRKHGFIAYDSRILSWNIEKLIASIWTVEGRQKIKYVTGEHHAKLLEYQQGESDLCYVKGKWYLHTICDVPDTEEQLTDDVLGVDLGITNIASTDDNKIFAGAELNQLRQHRQKVRSSLQSKGTRRAKQVLTRLSGRERTTVKIRNHTIAKAIVTKAKQEGKAIAVEDLKGIRENTNKRLRKPQRGLHNSWSFHQLQGYISYKAKREGIPVYFVPSPYTSKTCHCCKKIGKRNGEKFTCETCGTFHADMNAAKNIRALGLLVIQPESSTLFCDIFSIVGHVRQG